jgi:hypothetical protein
VDPGPQQKGARSEHGDYDEQYKGQYQHAAGEAGMGLLAYQLEQRAALFPARNQHPS